MVEPTMEAIECLLQQSGFKMTQPREATVRALLANRTQPISAEALYLYVIAAAPDTGLATVYRTLDMLTKLTVVHKGVFADGITRYTLCGTRPAHQLHCVRCGAIQEITEDFLSPIQSVVAQRYQFHVQDEPLIVRGCCTACYAKEEEHCDAPTT